MLALFCILSACGGGTEFDNENALNSNDGSNPPTNGSNPPNTDDPDDDEGSTPEPNTPEIPPVAETPEDLSSAIVSWNIPTARENGEELPLSDIGGYEILYRKLDEVVFTSVVVSDQNQSERIVEGLTPGQYEFFVLAFDAEGLYSDFSEPAIADIGTSI